MEPVPVPALRYARLETPVGPLWVAASERGLACVEFAKGRGEAQVLAEWAERTGLAAVHDEAAVRPYADVLQRYFAGDLAALDEVAVDFREGTAFQRRVWAALRRIPAGETRSYRWLAEQVGAPKGFRAVGSANGRNPVPIVVPCHRVVNADGRLGGYSSGLDMKRALLDLEGGMPARGPAPTP